MLNESYSKHIAHTHTQAYTTHLFFDEWKSSILRTQQQEQQLYRINMKKELLQQSYKLYCIFVKYFA